MKRKGKIQQPAPPRSRLYSAEPVTTQETSILFDCWRCGCRNELHLTLRWNGATPRLPQDTIKNTEDERVRQATK